MAKAQLKREPHLVGRGMATAGLALGYGLGLLMITAGVVFGIWFARANAALKAPPPPPTAAAAPAPGRPAAPNRPRPPAARVVSPEDISVAGLAIPDSAVAGKLRGQDFTSSSAVLENGVLKLRQGNSTPPDAEVTISLLLPPGESPAGKSWDTSKSQSQLPQIQFSIKSPNRNTRSKRSYTAGYGLRLEFGAEQDGKIAGKIYARFPDTGKSYIAGTFTAEVATSKPPATAVIRG